MLNASDLLSNLDRLVTFCAPHKRDSIKVAIPVKKLYATIGGTPCVDVESVSIGFDWDNGKLFVKPEKPVMLVEDYDMVPETIRKLQTEVGNLYYEISGYKAQIASLKRKLKENENEK
jgi:hypothetical protein